MEGFLKLSTAHTFQLGPFLDDTDGKTAETALTIGDTDCFLSKNGGAAAAKNDTTDLTGTGDTRGYYDCVLNTTDTNTVGTLKVMVHVTGALPVWATFQVLPAMVYDALMAAAGTDYLQVDQIQIDSTALATHASGMVAADLRDIVGAAVSTSTAQLGVNVVTQANIDFGALQKTSLNAATPASVTGAVGSVTGAVGSVTAGVTVTTNNDKTGYGLSAAAVQAIWDALTSALTTTGSIGKKLADWVVGTISTYTGNTPQTGDAYARIGAAGAGLTAIGDTRMGNLDATVSSRLAPAGTLATVTNLTNAPTSGDLTATMKSSVTTAATAATPAAASVTGAVGSIASGGITTGSFAAGAINAAAIADAAIDNATFAADVSTGGNRIATAVYNAMDTAFTDASGLTSNGLLERIRVLGWILRNKIDVTDANGNTVIYKDDSTTTGFSVNGMLTDDSTTTTRLRAV